MVRRGVGMFAAVLLSLVNVGRVGALVEPPAPAPIERPEAVGDQLVYYYDTRAGFTTFLAVRNVAPGPLTVKVEFYGPGLDTLPFELNVTVQAGGVRIIDAGASVGGGLEAQAGVAFATVVNDAGLPVVSGGLSGNFTVANLATGSAFGAPAAARSARNSDGSLPALADVIDYQNVSLQPIQPVALELAAYYNPNDLAPESAGGNQLIFVNFEDRIGPSTGVQVGATTWIVFAARNDGSVVADTSFTATGVVVSNLTGVLGAGAAGSSGNIRFTAFSAAPRVTRMIFFAETEGSSRSHRTPASDSADFDIFAVGFCRS